MFPEQNMPTGVAAAQANAEVEEEQVAVDPNQKIEVADQSKDINVSVPPPLGGKEYVVQWSVGEKGTELKASKKVGTFLVVPLVGNLVTNDEYNGFKVLDWITSIYSQLKQTSPVHDWLYKLGVTVPASISQGELQKLVDQTLAQKPMGTIELEWRASEKDPSNPRANKDGYVTLATKMTHFKRNPDGSYQNFFESKIDGSKLFAQAYVAAHLKR